MDLVEAVPNFSEGRRQEVLEAISVAAATPGHVLDLDPDPDHNRAVLTLAGGTVGQAAFAAVERAVQLIDLGPHAGVHPRVGAADVLPFVPLGATPMEACVRLAHEVGELIWRELRVPVYFYGQAGRHTLPQIRSAAPPPPDLGSAPHPTAGFACVGARPLLVAYNLLLPGLAVPEAAALARRLRASSGGLPGVQALAFGVTAGAQLSMNLTDLDACPPARALAEVVGLAGEAAIGADQVVGLCPARYGLPAAGGRILEARLAAAAARAGARACRARGGEELQLLAARLEAEAASLAALDWSQGELLGGAERAAALRRVLRAAGIEDPELALMLEVAAGGLRAALSGPTLNRFRARVEALDRWLGSDEL